MPNLIHLPTFNAQGALRVVVETPARSAVKIKYLPEEEVFEFGRPAEPIQGVRARSEPRSRAAPGPAARSRRERSAPAG